MGLVWLGPVFTALSDVGVGAASSLGRVVSYKEKKERTGYNYHFHLTGNQSRKEPLSSLFKRRKGGIVLSSQVLERRKVERLFTLKKAKDKASISISTDLIIV